MVLGALALAVQAQAPAAAPPDEPALPYTVQPSDKLIRLSRDLLNKPTDWNEVARFNRMRDPDMIRPGQTLRIPLRLLKRQAATARLVSAQGDVQLAGQPAAAGAEVPEGARLQVGANSSAVVELGDGSRVKLLPNTLADLASNHSYLMRDGQQQPQPWFAGAMRLARGAVETIAAKITNRALPLSIFTPTSVIGVRATEFRVAYDDTPARVSRAEVTQGQVRADNTAQQSGADLPRGTGAAVDPAQREVRVVPLLPAPDLSALPAQVNKPQGAWPLPTLAGASAYRVQVASDTGFDRIVRDLRVTGTSVDLGSLDVGSWNVRVRGIDGQGIEGFDAARVVAVAVPVPVIRPRVVSSGLRLADGRTQLQVGFEGMPAGAVTAVVAADQALAQPLQQGTVTNGVLDLGTIASGSYWVRFAGAGQTEVYRLVVPPSWGITVFDSFGPILPP